MTSPSSSIFCSFSATARPLLRRDDVDRLGALLTLARLELDFRSLGQRLEAVASDVGVMHEEILPAVLRRDESISLGIVEPLDGSGCHVNLPCFSERTSREGLESATGTRPDYRDKVAASPDRRVSGGCWSRSARILVSEKPLDAGRRIGFGPVERLPVEQRQREIVQLGPMLAQ